MRRVKLRRSVHFSGSHHQPITLSGSKMVLQSALKKLGIAEIPLTLLPDERGRQSHLRPWQDGFRLMFFFADAVTVVAVHRSQVADRMHGLRRSFDPGHR